MKKDVIRRVVLITGEVIEFEESGGWYAPRDHVILGKSKEGKRVVIDIDEVTRVSVGDQLRLSDKESVDTVSVFKTDQMRIETDSGTERSGEFLSLGIGLGGGRYDNNKNAPLGVLTLNLGYGLSERLLFYFNLIRADLTDVEFCLFDPCVDAGGLESGVFYGLGVTYLFSPRMRAAYLGGTVNAVRLSWRRHAYDNASAREKAKTYGLTGIAGIQFNRRWGLDLTVAWVPPVQVVSWSGPHHVSFAYLALRVTLH
ncbi:MAG: hypothetical protein JSW58_14745 [Candidatus Latescibacterota bacterium]|nr:MAG: hypothetical protein JSW58_14745 [Candidatus Latescibacterota bacterium]